jgi:replication factor C subunit 1
VFLNNFNAATKLLKGSEIRNLIFKEKMDLFFIDYDLVPLLVYENYLDAIQNEENLLEIADYIAFSDTLNEKIRG